jgi:hypothetical protein
MFTFLLVGGRFDDQGGKPSGYIKKLFDALFTIHPFGTLINGGKFEELGESKKFHGADVIFWMPDVPNEKEKIVRLIKKEYPTKLLVTSKNNLDQRYKLIDLVGKALQTKSNLFVEFIKMDLASQTIYTSVFDPLGNCYCHHSSNIKHVAIALISRIQKLLTFTRVSSEKQYQEKIVPKISENFLNQIRKYADRFHECIHADTTRFLGNVSFRCEKGFPSIKIGNQIYVSKRNIDKREIDNNGFVPVELVVGTKAFCPPNNFFVNYNGIDKPSVDAPIQLMLYGYYNRINYMIHSHTYILGKKDGLTYNVPFTKEVIPCGAIEEFYEIVEWFPNPDEKTIFINLKGHGSIAMFSNEEDFNKVVYEPRPMPEFQTWEYR